MSLPANELIDDISFLREVCEMLDKMPARNARYNLTYLWDRYVTHRPAYLDRSPPVIVGPNLVPDSEGGGR